MLGGDGDEGGTERGIVWLECGQKQTSAIYADSGFKAYKTRVAFWIVMESPSWART